MENTLNQEQFEQFFEEQVERCRSVLCHKAEAYASGEDMLHNFRVAAALHGGEMISALAGMMAKHTVSIYDMCNSGQNYSPDVWEEKITDHLNYLFLLNALIKQNLA